MARFMLKRFYVEAFQVTPQNMKDLARWCGGDIHETPERDNQNRLTGNMLRFIATNKNPNDRQARAFAGDWIVQKMPRNRFKVFSHAQFIRNYEPA